EVTKQTLHPNYPLLLAWRGEALYEIGHYDEAADFLSRARDGYAALGGTGKAAEAAEARGDLAMVRWEKGERATAVADVRMVLAELTAQPHPDDKVIAKFRGWLAHHATSR